MLVVAAIACHHATVVPMVGDGVLADHTVVVRGDRIVALAPSDELRARLRNHVRWALAAATRVKDVDAVLVRLQAAPDPVRIADGLLAAQLRRSELGDDALSSIGDLEARIEVLRQTLDVARSAALAIRGIAQRLATLHDRLAATYLGGGNPDEAARHDRRAVAYRTWSQP